MKAAVVVASNRAAAGVYDDTTGPLIVDALQVGDSTWTHRPSYPTATRSARPSPQPVAGGARVVPPAAPG